MLRKKREIFLLIYLIICCLPAVNRSLAQTSGSDPQQDKVLSTDETVRSQNRLVTEANPDSLASLPFGIVREVGTVRYIVCIDSATFRPGTSTFSAYMALEFPGSQNKICFAAKDVGFNPKGVFATSSSRLMLVSEHRIALGPKVVMVLKPDGYNYVEWDCNGFQSVNLKGYFEFDPEMIYGVSQDGSSNDSTVKASFEVHCNDIHNFICQLNMSPFSVKGMKGFVFTVTDATVDMSEVSNHPVMSFPPGYVLDAGMTQEMWTGFYLKSFKVKLPPELKRKDETIPEIFASNMILDNTGVTGVFGATNVFTIANGSMSSWEFSLDNINVHLTQNHINGAGLGGKIKIPGAKNTEFTYAASMSQNFTTNEMNYNFGIQPKSNVEFNVFSAKVTLNNNSIITVIKQNGRFVPEAKLAGVIDLVSGDLKDSGIIFQNLVIATQSPYIKSGTFALVGSSSGKLGNFPISISNIGLAVHPTSPAIFADIGLNLMASEDFSFSASTTVFAIGKITPPALPNEKPQFGFDRIAVNNISLEVNTQSFYLKGIISWKNNDPVYGKGFFGGFQLKIDGVLNDPASSNVWFGSVNGMKYWYVDATVPVKFEIGAVTIKRLKGALSYHMNCNQSIQDLAANIHSATTLTNPLSFTPNSARGLSFSAGVFFCLKTEKAGNGEVALSVNFNSSSAGGGLHSIALAGKFRCLGSQSESESPNGHKVHGDMTMIYEDATQTFHAVFNATLSMPKVTGNGQIVIHIDPSLWYVCVGKPSQRINVNIQSVGNLTAYLMVGQQLEAMPSPPPQLLELVNSNGLNNGRNDQQLNDASGMVAGVMGSVAKSGDFGFENFEIYYGFWAQAGLDLMMLNYGPNAHCAGSTDKAGINGWYAQGQVYVYLSGNVGVRGHIGHDFDFTILNLSAGALLAGQAPRPFYFTGAIGCDYDILGVIDGHFDFNFEIGDYCNIQQ